MLEFGIVFSFGTYDKNKLLLLCAPKLRIHVSLTDAGHINLGITRIALIFPRGKFLIVPF